MRVNKSHKRRKYHSSHPVTSNIAMFTFLAPLWPKPITRWASSLDAGLCKQRALTEQCGELAAPLHHVFAAQAACLSSRTTALFSFSGFPLLGIFQWVGYFKAEIRLYVSFSCFCTSPYSVLYFSAGRWWWKKRAHCVYWKLCTRAEGIHAGHALLYLRLLIFPHEPLGWNPNSKWMFKPLLVDFTVVKVRIAFWVLDKWKGSFLFYIRGKW